MLDTNICSFIMRERPPAVLDRLQQAVAFQNSIAISVITYYEMLLGAFGTQCVTASRPTLLRPSSPASPLFCLGTAPLRSRPCASEAI